MRSVGRTEQGNRTEQNRTELNQNKKHPKTSKYNKTVSQNKRLVIVLYNCTVGSHQGVVCVCVGGVSKLAKNSPASKR